MPVGNGEIRRLLDDVSGFVALGKPTVLMGESGAGITSSLDVLAQRVTTGVVTGDRLVNAQPLRPNFRAQTGYVQQMDSLVPTTTVREALLFPSTHHSVQIHINCVDYIVTLYRLRRPSGRPPDYTTYSRHRGRRTNI